MGGLRLLVAQAGKADPVTARAYNRLSNHAEHCCYNFLVIVHHAAHAEGTVAWPSFATQVKP